MPIRNNRTFSNLTKKSIKSFKASKKVKMKMNFPIASGHKDFTFC